MRKPLKRLASGMALTSICTGKKNGNAFPLWKGRKIGVFRRERLSLSLPFSLPRRPLGKGERLVRVAVNALSRALSLSLSRSLALSLSLVLSLSLSVFLYCWKGRKIRAF